jgi:hypothetical protein
MALTGVQLSPQGAAVASAATKRLAGVTSAGMTGFLFFPRLRGRTNDTDNPLLLSLWHCIDV